MQKIYTRSLKRKKIMYLHFYSLHALRMNICVCVFLILYLFSRIDYCRPSHVWGRNQQLFMPNFVRLECTLIVHQTQRSW